MTEFDTSVVDHIEEHSCEPESAECLNIYKINAHLILNLSERMDIPLVCRICGQMRN